VRERKGGRRANGTIERPRSEDVALLDANCSRECEYELVRYECVGTLDSLGHQATVIVIAIWVVITILGCSQHRISPIC